MFYSPSIKGFFVKEIHGDSIPADVLEISMEVYLSLLDGQSTGKVIQPGVGGFPTLVAPPAIPPTQAEQEAFRQAAYIAEADPLYFKWQAGEATEADWLAKRQEIRDRYPYPGE